jgi:hypothetical protein
MATRRIVAPRAATARLTRRGCNAAQQRRSSTSWP